MSLALIIADRDGERQIAIPRGLELASKMGWGAQVVVFVYESLDAIGARDKALRGKVKSRLMVRRKREVEALVEANKPDKLRTTVTVVWESDIHRWISRQCERKDYSVVVKAAHRTGSLVYTSSDWHLLRECPVPVMLVAEKKWRSTKPVVAAVDLATDSRVKQRLNNHVISTARKYAEKIGCPLYLVHAVHFSAILRELDLVDEYSYAKKLKEALRPQAAKIASAHHVPMKNIILKEGPVERVVASEAARLKAQVVVMGVTGRSGLKVKVLGNTAERVMMHMRTDLLALKP